MAFSTQKEFFNVQNMHEMNTSDAAKAKLKTYYSNTDERTWVASDNKKSKYIKDLLSSGAWSRNNNHSRGDPSGGLGGTKGNGGRKGGRGKGKLDKNCICENDVCSRKRKGSSSDSEVGQATGYSSDSGSYAAVVYGRDGNLIVGDSVLNAAEQTIERLEELIDQNKKLQKQLNDSNERHKTANEENKEIQRIMRQKYDKEMAKVLRQKVKQLANAGQIDCIDQSELYKICDSIDDMNRAQDILKAENATLKRLIEKQSKRCKLEDININPERCNDIAYLQNKIDLLQREVTMLRCAEDVAMKGKKFGCYNPSNDLENIEAILNERNVLREKCKTLKDLEKKAAALQEAAGLYEDMHQKLNCQEHHIIDMEAEMESMQKYYQQELEKCKFSEEMMKCRYEDLKHKVLEKNANVERCNVLQMENYVLRDEIRKRNNAINNYDSKFQQQIEQEFPRNQNTPVPMQNCLTSFIKCESNEGYRYRCGGY